MAVSIKNMCNRAFEIARDFIQKDPETIINVLKTDIGWKVRIEVLERRSVPDTQDLLGRYDLEFSDDGKLLGWQQVMVRKRSDRMVPEEEEWLISA